MAMTREELEGTAATPARTITAAMAAAIDPSGNVLNSARGSFDRATVEELTLEEVLFAAVDEGNLSVAARTLEFGADVNLRVAYCLPLHKAVQTASLDMVKFLLAHKADPNSLSRLPSSKSFPVCFSPIGVLWNLDRSVTHDGLLILQELLRHGADPNVECSPLHDDAAGSNILRIIQKQARHGSRFIFDIILPEERLIYNQMIDALLAFGADLPQARIEFLAYVQSEQEEVTNSLEECRKMEAQLGAPSSSLDPEEEEADGYLNFPPEEGVEGDLEDLEGNIAEDEEKLVYLESLKKIGLKIFDAAKLRREEKLRCVFNQGVVAGFNGMSADVANHMLLPLFRESRKDASAARVFNLGYNTGIDKFAAAEEAKKIKDATIAAARASAVDAMAARMVAGASSAAANPTERESGVQKRRRFNLD